MNLPSWLTAICRALPLIVATAAANASPREQVASVAQVIEDEYFDAQRGKEIAEGLRAKAEAGEFDALTHAPDLASELTRRLKPLDAHFNVRFEAGPPPPEGAGPGPIRRVRREGPGDGAGAGPAPVRRGRGDGPARDTGIVRVEMLPGRVGILELRQFAHFEFDTPDQPARRAIDAALELLAGADAVIVDLRGNGGGSPAMVGYLTSAFTARGADIYNTFHSRRGTRSEAPREWYPNPRLEVPLFVLTSGRTGSAAEAFAYTVKNAKRARVVGETTSGAANPGGDIRLDNGFVMFVSFGSPKSPVTHTNWEGSGVQPDEAVAQEAALDTAHQRALEAILAQHDDDAHREARWTLDLFGLRAMRLRAIDTARYVGNYGLWRVSAEGGALSMKRGRWPPLQLQSLGGDLFAVSGDPRRRVQFARPDPGSDASAFELLDANGPPSRHRRDAGAVTAGGRP